MYKKIIKRGNKEYSYYYHNYRRKDGRVKFILNKIKINNKIRVSRPIKLINYFKDRIRQGLFLYKIILEDNSELLVSPGHKIYVKVEENSFSKSLVLNILTLDCCLNTGSLDQIAQFNFNASANTGISLSCVSCLACDSNSLYSSGEIVETCLTNSSIADSICSDLNLEYLRRSDLLFLNSSILYFEVNNSNPSNLAFIIINLTGFSLKKENNIFVSTTNSIYQPSSLCLFQTRSFNSLPSLMQSSSVNLESFNDSSNFLSINNLLVLSVKNSLTNADQFVSGNCSISFFNFSGIDNVKLGIFESPLNSVYSVKDVELYKSSGEVICIKK